MSRPNRAEAPSVDFHVRLSPAERVRVDAAAKANHQTSSQFTRDVLMDAADECLDDLHPSALDRSGYPATYDKSLERGIVDHPEPRVAPYEPAHEH